MTRRTRTGDPGLPSPRKWRCGVNLACPHETRIELGEAASFEAAYNTNHALPLRKDGYWPRAQRCPQCRRVRAVKSVFVELIP